ncbi:Os01g0250401 [Oryza sativa Japonica Group]|uniref:Os01g0250401 protein n=1 Tax=Oryza sativa subsp. japonica TaxID=39947 RepID=A0A0N7KCN9_ORYSJ|nr:Os01g0250401 [Oryza sativa Japonica Group]
MAYLWQSIESNQNYSARQLAKGGGGAPRAVSKGRWPTERENVVCNRPRAMPRRRLCAAALACDALLLLCDGGAARSSEAEGTGGAEEV